MKYLLSQYRDDYYSYNLLKASLLQKLIRRGMVGEALFIASIYIHDGHSKALKRRLQVIAAEDVGLGWPESTMFIAQEEDLLKVTSALCQANKNREPDKFLHTVRDHFPSVRGRGQEILIESASLNKLLLIAQEWENNKKPHSNLTSLKDAFTKLTELAVLSDVVEQLGENYLELVRGKIHGADDLLALLVLLAIRKVQPTLWTPDLTQLTIVPFDEMFDFALDMHTPIGKSLNRKFDHWVKEGSVVIPEIKYPELYDNRGNLKYDYK